MREWSSRVPAGAPEPRPPCPRCVMREFRQLETDAVHESPNNPRRKFSQASLEELAASVRRVGVLQPILVRPNGHGFVLIAGARRFRAAKLAGCATIPARVLAL